MNKFVVKRGGMFKKYKILKEINWVKQILDYKLTNSTVKTKICIILTNLSSFYNRIFT